LDLGKDSKKLIKRREKSMTNNEFVSAKTYAIVFLLLGLVWNCIPVASTVHGQTSKEQAKTTTAAKSRTEKEEKVVFQTDSNSDLWGSNDTSARGGNGGGGGGKGKGKTPDPTPTPTPDPTPTPTPTPSPTPTPDSGSALATQWEVASRSGLKFYVDHSGWYKVSAQELSANGFDPSSDNYYWQLFRDGVEVPIGVDVDGSVEFFGSGSDSRYSKYGVYYLMSGDQAGLRLQEASDQGAGSTASESYLTQVTEKPRNLYVTRVLNGEEENWFGPAIDPSVEVGVPFTIDDPDLSQPNARIKLTVSLQGFTYTSHLVSVRFNGYSVGTISFDNQNKASAEFDIPASAAFAGQNSFFFQGLASASDVSVVDFVAVTFAKRLRANGQKIRFGVSAGDSARVGGFNDANFSVYEVTAHTPKKKVSVVDEVVNGTVGFSLSADNRDREFVAVAESQKENVVRIESNLPSSWHGSFNSADFIIVAPYAFQAAAEELAARRNAQGLPSVVVNVEDIADEFGFGIKSPVSLRSFFQSAVDRWSNAPEYILLFGDSSYDQRNYLGLSQTRDFVSTKLIETFDMETSSDGWLVDFDNDGVEDLSIGRLPAANTTEAANMVAKIVRYENYSGSSTRTAAMVADTWFEIPNQNLEALLPSNVSSTRIDRSVLGDAAARQAIKDNADAGPTMVSYLGHGTTLGWTGANLFTKSTAMNLTNDKLSFYLLMTCLNGYSIDAQSDSLAESLIKAPNAAIAAWASSGSTYASGQTLMSQDVVNRLFSTNGRIGDIVRLGKQTSSDWDVRRTWQLFGDPTVVIR
jgi:hypothetical protein